MVDGRPNGSTLNHKNNEKLTRNSNKLDLGVAIPCLAGLMKEACRQPLGLPSTIRLANMILEVGSRSIIRLAVNH